MSEVANLLKKGRIQSGYSQQHFAEKLGFTSGQFVSNWERNLAKIPPTSYKKICTVLKMKKELLFEALVNDYRKDLRKILK
jgi:transcriptional regulator with XRE-family HTH domain